MEDKYKIKFILHSSDFKDFHYIKVLKQVKIIEGKEINFEFTKELFNQFEISLPTQINILDINKNTNVKFTLNLLKNKNTYHFFSGVNLELYELLFYNEDNIEIIVDNEEIKEYDSFGKFKRFSLINTSNYEIKVNGTIINLKEYLYNPNHNNNSFQLSFYDINQKYIVSKRIIKINNMNFSLFYEKYINELNNCSLLLDLLCSNKTEFENDFNRFYSTYLNVYLTILDELNLNIPKSQLEKYLNEDKYLNFIYLFVKLQIFYIFQKSKNKGFENFNKLFNYLKTFFEKLKKVPNFKVFEKISVLFHFGELFDVVKSCDIFLNTDFKYIKVDEIENNSVIYLAIDFLNKYIDNLNEESPSFFKLIEINSGYGYYKQRKTFTYDMIDISDLKSHLKEIIPSVICFYSLSNTDNSAFTYPAIGRVCVNESQIFEGEEKFSMDKNYFNTKKDETKNAAMKLALKLEHECFGHIKFRFHSDFYYKRAIQTPKKCFENKMLKRLVGINDNIKNNTINILSSSKKSDSGHYYESSYGKLPGTRFYTFVYLKLLKDMKNLIDHPELFYSKDNLEKLQKFSYYKYLYENNNENEKAKELKSFNFEQELKYLTDFFANYDKSSIISEKDNLIDIKNKKLKKKIFLGNKRKRNTPKKCDNINKIIKPEQEEINPKIKTKKKRKLIRTTDREKLLKILRNKNLDFSQQQYYVNLLLETNYKV